MATKDEDRLEVVLIKKKAEHQLDLIEFSFYSMISSSLNFFSFLYPQNKNSS